MNAITPITADLTAILSRQRSAYLRDGPPPLKQRRADLKALKQAILSRQDAFVAALDKDFGHRSREETLMLDIGSTVNAINYLIAHLPRLMRSDPRDVSMIFMPGTNRVIYQPLGVVGVVSPWNYPISLALVPLATALAAGNRAMLKPSEIVPATSDLLVSTLAATFPQDKVAVVTGDAKVGAAFSALPFDYLLFTGSIPVGKSIMRAASDNLVPVTLELGGKSPVIVGHGFDIATAARRVAYGKLANGGQTCVAPDYALVPEDEVEAFVEAFKTEAAKLYPDIGNNPNYTWIVNEHHFGRLTGLVDDAKAKGARAIELGSKSNQAGPTRLFLPTLLLGVNDGMSVMQDEIFGPVLPIVPYRTLEEAIAYVNARPRPLALYLFSTGSAVRRTVLERTTSGNVVIDDTILHYAQDDLPFGGVGSSGMGAYHGPEGFRSMSHAKGVYTQARFNLADLFRPPYGGIFDVLLKFILR